MTAKQNLFCFLLGLFINQGGEEVRRSPPSWRITTYCKMTPKKIIYNFLEHQKINISLFSWVTNFHCKTSIEFKKIYNNFYYLQENIFNKKVEF